MPIDSDAALDTVDRLRGYQRKLLARLVSCRSVRGEPSDIHELCGSELDKLGMEVELVVPQVEELRKHPEWCPPHPAVDTPEALVSVLGSWGEGPGIFLFAHTDTEDPETQPGWKTDPYQATPVENRIHGLGAADDKAGVVSVLAAVRALLPRLEGVRVVVGLVHGKLGGSLGTLPVMARVGEVDSAIYCHPAETGQGMAHFKMASRGFFSFRIETAGRRPPPMEIRTPVSEDPRQGVNALNRLRQVLNAVDDWASRQGVICSINQVEAGANPVVLPERAVALGSVWFGQGTSLDVHQRLSQAAMGAGARSVDLVGMRSNPAEVPLNHILPAATSLAIRAETGVTPKPYPAHVASDIRFPIRCLNAPTVGFGPLAGNFYGPNEWVDTEDMHRATRVIFRMVSSWAIRVTRGAPRRHL